MDTSGRVNLEANAHPPLPGHTAPGRRVAAQIETRDCGVHESGASDRPALWPSRPDIPLFRAAASRDVEHVCILLAAGASITQRDDEGRTALFHAGSAEVARTLIEAGVDLAATSDDGRDALGHAAFHHDVRAVSFLLKLGAGVATHQESPTALHWICWQGESPDPETNSSCERIIRDLVAAGIPVNSRNDRGRTPMHDAAEGTWGNQTAVQTLLALGADPDAADPGGSTPLMLAAARGETGCVRLLLEAGADPTRADSDGSTALDHARGHHAMWVALHSAAATDRPASETADATSPWQDALGNAADCLNLVLCAARAGA